MAPWRARARKIIFRRRFPTVVGEYPLEMGMILWGFFALTNVIVGSAPKSNALQVLPDHLEQLWGVLLGVAALTVLVGLSRKRLATVATGMYLFGSTLVAYSAAIIGAAGWQRGGAIAGFLLVIGLVCFLRGWWLKEMEAALVEAHASTQRKD